MLYRVEIDPLKIGVEMSSVNALNASRTAVFKNPAVNHLLSYLVEVSQTNDLRLFDVCKEAVAQNPVVANFLPGIWEILMEKARPLDVEKKRTDCVFFFTDKGDALRYKNSYPGMSNGVLCEVSVISQNFYKECDMSWLDDVDENTIKAGEAIDVFKRYWAGEYTEHPVIEVLFCGTYLLKPIE